MTPIRDVEPADWRATLASLRDDGYALLGFITAVDRGDRLEVLARVERPEPFAVAMVRTAVAADAPVLDSVTGLWSGADWHEREAGEMFGIMFDGRPTAPLLLREPAAVPPMRRQVLLAARAARPWPGSFEPGKAGANASRRRLLPPGVTADAGAGA